MHLISVTVYLFLVTLIVIIWRHKCRNRSCCCHGNAVFLVFPSSLFFTNRILRKVESWVLQPVGSEGQRPCFFSLSRERGWDVMKGGGGGEEGVQARDGRCDQRGCCTSFCEWKAFRSSEPNQLFVNEDSWSGVACRTYRKTHQGCDSAKISGDARKKSVAMVTEMHHFCSRLCVIALLFPRKCVCLFIYLSTSLSAFLLVSEAPLIRHISLGFIQ